MAVIYCHLERSNNKCLKFLVNKSSHFEISASFFKPHPSINTAPESFNIRWAMGVY